MYTQVCEHPQSFEVADTLLTTNSQETLQDEVSSANEIEQGDKIQLERPEFAGVT